MKDNFEIRKALDTLSENNVRSVEVNFAGKVKSGFLRFYPGTLKKDDVADLPVEMRLFFYLLQNVNRDNIVLVRQQYLAKFLKCTRQTVASILHLFENAKIIKYNSPRGVLMLNPRLFSSGRSAHDLDMQYSWDHFEELYQ